MQTLLENNYGRYDDSFLHGNVICSTLMCLGGVEMHIILYSNDPFTFVNDSNPHVFLTE
jgi:hypothetical protein